jgi:tetratricopeptide (TPR) repeat protein
LACSAFDCENDEEKIQRLKEFQVYCEEHELIDPENPDTSLMFGEVYEELNKAYYSVAKTAQSNGQYDRAIELYMYLGNYEDSIDRLLQCYDASGINYAFFDVRPVNAGNKGGYAKTDSVTDKNLQYGWKLGRFIIAGYTEETSNGVFLKTLGDDIVLLFDIDQDINSLNGNPKMSIEYDKEAKDVPFNYSEKDASFGLGTLFIQREDFRHNKTLVPPYTNYLAANDTGVANTRVETNEEGTYEVALDYLIKTSGVTGKTEGYRINFSFDVKNGDGVAFLRDVKTTSELQDYSVTKDGFKIDLAGSHSVKVHVTRKDININGTDLDVREDKPASNGDSFTKEGYYIIEMTNSGTGTSVEKHIFVGDQATLRQFLQVDPELGKFVK